jgi:hypothetical protein
MLGPSVILTSRTLRHPAFKIDGVLNCKVPLVVETNIYRLVYGKILQTFMHMLKRSSTHEEFLSCVHAHLDSALLYLTNLETSYPCH